MSNVRPGPAWPTTTEEFLVWAGDGRAKRYQLIDSEIWAMSPGSAVHGLIQARLTSAIHQHLQRGRTGCKVLTEAAVKPRLRADRNVRVPDIAITCSPILAGQVVIDDPVLLIEILSPSNKAKTWTNVWAYTTIPSVKEIVVVRSMRIEVQILRPSAERIWPDSPEMIVPGGTLRLDSIGFACPVEEIYADTPLG